MDGGLEECDRWKLEVTNPEYEEYKCKVLRVHASVQNGKCTCNINWKGGFFEFDFFLRNLTLFVLPSFYISVYSFPKPNLLNF